MQAVDDLFEAFGGVTEVASVTGSPLGTVSAWKTRGSIPPTYWPRLIAAAAERGISGVTYESLTLMAARRKGAEVPFEVGAA